MDIITLRAIKVYKGMNDNLLLHSTRLHPNKLSRSGGFTTDPLPSTEKNS